MSSELESQSAQSKIDSLQELNSQLIATIAELRRENAEVKAENTKLKQVIEANAELKTRFEELEKKNKTDTSPMRKSSRKFTRILQTVQKIYRKYNIVLFYLQEIS
jgi:hypothetical protein